MSEYREIQGAAVQALASNTGTIEGQIWYDTANGQFKLEAISVAGAFASGGTIGAARSGGLMFAAGTQSATVMSNGATPTSPPPDYTQRTDEYDGTSWAVGNNSTQPAANSLSSAGVLTAALMAGGFRGPLGMTNYVETYDGTSFAAGTAMSSAREGAFGAGISTAMFVSSGGPISGGSPTTTEEWDGVSWSPKGAIGAHAQSGGSSGTVAAGLAFGGNTSYPTTVSVNKTYDYSSPTWTAGGDLNTPRGGGGPTMGGSQTATLYMGGNNRPGGIVTNNEEYDGTCWSNTTVLPAARENCGGTGTSTLGLVSGGNLPAQTDTCLEWTGAGSAVTRTITTT